MVRRLIHNQDVEWLQGLTDLVYEFRDHKLHTFLGDINYYLEQRKARDMREIEKSTKVEDSSLSRKRNNNNSKPSYEQQKKIKSLNNRLSNAESEINKLERSIEKMDAELAADYEKTAADNTFFEKYEAKKKSLEEWMKKWEAVSEEIDALD